MRYEEILITPSMASSFLENNNTNRRYEPKRAAAYAKDMMNGKWELNGEDIEISKSGELKNGQHRLNAIIISNIPVKMGVKFDVPDEVTIYDRGRSRSTADIFAMRGMDYEISCQAIISMTRLHFVYAHSINNISDNDVYDFIKKYENSIRTVYSLMSNKQSTKQGTRVNCKNAILLLGVFYAVEAGVDASILDDFLRVVNTGLPDSLDQSAALILRNDIISGAFKLPGTQSKKTGVTMVEKAIYDFVNHYQRKKSYKGTVDRVYYNLFKED